MCFCIKLVVHDLSSPQESSEILASAQPEEPPASLHHVPSHHHELPGTSHSRLASSHLFS